MTKQDIRFVIVTYKPDKNVLGRLLVAIDGWPVEVVDNTQKNLGFGAAANRGMKKAFAAGATWVVVCNQDIQLTRMGITHFCAMARNCDPEIVGPEAGSLDPVRWTTILNENEREFHKATPCKKPRGGLRKPDYISGSMMAIHKDVWERVGGFFEPYFMYYEDADLCVRAKKAGFALRQVHAEGFRHESDRPNASKKYYLARNHGWFVLRNAPMRVKLRELLRLPKTLFELWS